MIFASQEFRQSHLSHPKLFKPGCLKADTSSCSNTSETPQPIVITWEQSQDFGAYQALSSTLSLGTKKRDFIWHGCNRCRSFPEVCHPSETSGPIWIVALLVSASIAFLSRATLFTNSASQSSMKALQVLGRSEVAFASGCGDFLCTKLWTTIQGWSPAIYLQPHGGSSSSTSGESCWTQQRFRCL